MYIASNRKTMILTVCIGFLSLVTSVIIDAIDELGKDAELCMGKCVETLKAQIRREIKRARASSPLLDKIQAIEVELDGYSTPLQEVAHTTIGGNGNLVITVWGECIGEACAVEKAIRNSGLGLNPSPASPLIEGYRIRVPLPPQRKEHIGQTSPSLKDEIQAIQVECSGSRSPLRDLASVNFVDGNFEVTVWGDDIAEAFAVEKAIRDSGLGLNPSSADADPWIEGYSVSVKPPPLTEGRRRDLGKVVRDLAVKTRVAIRNVSRDANLKVKALLKDKSSSEEDERRSQNHIQKLMDTYIWKIDDALSAEEAEIMKS